MSNLNRFIIGLATLASLVLTGCGGTLVIGGKPTYAQNRTPAVCSWNQSDSRYGGTKQQAYSQTCTETYDLGDLRCTRTWSQSNATQNAPGTQYDGRSSSYNSSQPYCVQKPQPPVVKPPVVETPPVKALTPTPKDATCGDFRNGGAPGRLIRDCYTREDQAAGRMSCLRGWEEVWVGGVFQVTGIDSATWNCSPKAAPAQSAAPRAEDSRNDSAIPQARRPNYGR